MEPMTEYEKEQFSDSRPAKVLRHETEDGKHYTVFFENDIAETFSDEEFFEFGLYDTELPLSVTHDCLIYRINIKRAYYKALSFLRGSLKPIRVVAAKLSGDGFSREVIEATTKRLMEEGSLDDKRYCLKQVKKRLDGGNSSCFFIICELRERGVDEDITKACLEELGADDLSIAREIVAKKKKAGNNPDKIKRFLSSKGFSANTIMKACDDREYLLYISQ